MQHTHSAQTCEWLHDVLLTVHCQIADEEVISLLQPFFAAPHAKCKSSEDFFPLCEGLQSMKAI